MPPCFVIQAVVLNVLQNELSGLPSALALAPVGMAIITVMIVVLHIIVNAEDIGMTAKMSSLLAQLKKLWFSRKHK